MPYQSKYVKTPPTRITLERFLEMLNVLPPSRWYRQEGIEWFHVCEPLTDELVSWYARVADTYWEFQDTPTLTHGQIAEMLLKARHP